MIEYRETPDALEGLIARLGDRYSIDLVCDPELVPFYRRLGGIELAGMGWRNRAALDAAREA